MDAPFELLKPLSFEEAQKASTQGWKCGRSLPSWVHDPGGCQKPLAYLQQIKVAGVIRGTFYCDEHAQQFK
jgi:hypothetical protein